MKSSRLIVLLTSLAVASVGMGARAEPTASDIADAETRNIAIQTLASWNIAFNGGGLDDYADLYTEDAVVMTPAGEIATGAEIQDFWKMIYGVGINTHALDVTTIDGNDGQIVVTSRWEALRSPENDVIFEGRMISVLEQQSDGRWRTAYQRWN